MKDYSETYKRLVDYFGTQTATAKNLGVKQPSVNAWVTGRSHMSLRVARRAEKITKGEFTEDMLSRE